MRNGFHEGRLANNQGVEVAGREPVTALIRWMTARLWRLRRKRRPVSQDRIVVGRQVSPFRTTARQSCQHVSP